MQLNKEILEEAAKNYASYTHKNGEKVEIGKYFDETKKSHFISGAKWQAKRMYSEEEVKIAMKNSYGIKYFSEAKFLENLEQFKKK